MNSFIFPDEIQNTIVDKLYDDIFVYKKNKVLALDTGIGKTIVAGCVINRFVQDKRKTVCVICSPSVYHNVWYEHLLQYGFVTFFYHGLERKNIYYTNTESVHIPDMNRFDVIFTSYEIFSLEYEQLLNDRNVGFLVVDEMQKVLNSKKENAFIKAIQKTTELSKLVLTATPLQNSILDVLVLGNIMQDDPDYISLDEYKKDYYKIVEKHKNGNLGFQDKYRFNDIINCVNDVKDKMIIYYSKEGYSEINPEIQFVDRFDYAFFLPLSENEFVGYQNIETSANIHNKPSVLTYFISCPLLKKFKKYLFSGDMVVQNITKYRAALAIILSVNTFDKIVVFSNYKNVVEYYKNGFYKDGICALSITGDNSMDERSLILKKFKSDRSIKVLLMTLSASAEGLNIEVANHVIFIDMWHNPVKHKQGSDRVHRRTQIRNCFVYYLIADKCSSELSLMRTLQRKSLYYKLIFSTSLFNIHSYRIKDNKDIEKEIGKIVNNIQVIKQIADTKSEIPKQEPPSKNLFDSLAEFEINRVGQTINSNNHDHNPDDDIEYKWDDEIDKNDEYPYQGYSSFDYLDFSDS